MHEPAQLEPEGCAICHKIAKLISPRFAMRLITQCHKLT